MICILSYLELLLNGISAFASLATLILAIILAKAISFKRHLRQKQLDTVFELVSHLQNLKLYFSYMANEKHSKEQNMLVSYSGDVWLYFFNMTKAKGREKFKEAFKDDHPEIFISEKFLYQHPIFQFVHNPFLPKKIALKLIKLYPRGGNQVNYSLKQNEIYIADDRAYGSHTYRQEISQYYKSLENIFNSTEELNKSIRDWLKKYGVKDLNLMSKPINTTNYP